MRTIEEINKDIDAINSKKQELDEQLHQLRIERGEYWKRFYEQKYGMKRGDLIDLGREGKVYYDYVKPFGSFHWVYCRKVKKDGTPSRTQTSFLPSSFDGCKIIGHAELPDL